MPTNATAFAQTTRYVKDPQELRRRVLSLYRAYVRSAPTFAETYELSYPTAQIRTKIRQEFERNRFVSDVAVINVLEAKGQMEFQETINFWKQHPHIHRYFETDEKTQERPKGNDFVSRFLEVSA